MTRTRMLGCVGAVLFSLGLLAAGVVHAETATAPLNGTVSFTTASATQDTLKVSAGDKTVKATEAIKIQGHANSQITVVSTAGTGDVHVATVTLREGDSLYNVQGVYQSTATGGATSTWDANYNKGGARILLEVNEPGAADDYVAYGDNGGTLTLRLAGGTAATNYSVALTDAGNGTPAGDVGFSSTPVVLSGPTDTKTVNLNGVTCGGVTITGTCDDADNGTATATVVPAVSKIQYQSGENWVDISGTLYVMKGTTVTFKAIPNPAEESWPTGKPV